MVLPLLVCKTWRVIASNDHDLNNSRAAAAAVVIAATESMARQQAANRRSSSDSDFDPMSYYRSESDHGSYGWGGYGGYDRDWDGDWEDGGYRGP